MTHADLPKRLRDRLVIDPETGCWEWSGSHTTAGYGNLSWEGKAWYIHRLVWTLLRGEVPPKLHIDHLCRNRGCANPDHLEPVTHKVNVRRGARTGPRGSTVTHCPQGHEYAKDGKQYWHKADNCWGWHCLVCQRERAAKRRARLRVERQSATF